MVRKLFYSSDGPIPYMKHVISKVCFFSMAAQALQLLQGGFELTSSDSVTIDLFRFYVLSLIN